MYAAFVVISLVSLVALLAITGWCIRLIAVDRARRTWGYLAVSVMLMVRIAVQWIAVERGTLDVSATVIVGELVLLGVVLLFAVSTVTIPRMILSLEQSNRTLEQLHDELTRRVQARSSELALTVDQLRDQAARTDEVSAALHAVRDIYVQTLDVQPDRICRYRPDGTITFVNRAYCVYFDKARDELIGTNLFDVLRPEIRASVHEAIDRLSQDTPVVSTEQRLTTSEGEQRELWTRLAIFDRDGTLSEIQAVGRDITAQYAAESARRESEERAHALLEMQVRERTADLERAQRALEREIAERRRAEIALRQSENQLRTTLDALDDMVYVVDENLRITLCNAAFLAYTQESGLETNPIGRTPFELFAYLSDDLRDQFKAVFASGSALAYHERFQIGQLTVVNEARKIPIKTGDRVTHVVTVLHDITVRQNREDALRQSEERLRTLINATPDIICVKDGDGHWLIANDAVRTVFELENVDYVGKTDLELAALRPRYREALTKCNHTDELAWQSGTLQSAEEIVPQRDETQRIFDVVKVPLFDAQGHRKELIIMGRDITERRRAE